VPRGDTAAICVAAFRTDWLAHVPMRDLCDRYSVSRDQVVRLRDYWSLPKRHDRSLRRVPDRMPEPDAAEIAASEASLSLAPAIAVRVTCVQISWSDAVRAERQVTRATPFTLRQVDVPDVLRDDIDGESASAWG